MTKYVQQRENSTNKVPDEGCFLRAAGNWACVVSVKMAKRGADKELTQENWDHEEEDEEVSSSFRSFQFVLALVFVRVRVKVHCFTLGPVAG